jgi:hypothetical protein
MSIKIKKISTNMCDYVNVIGDLNLENKKMNFEISLNNYKIIIPIDPRMTASNIDFFVNLGRKTFYYE